MQRRFHRLLREYFVWGTAFVVFLIVVFVLYLLDAWLNWGWFA